MSRDAKLALTRLIGRYGLIQFDSSEEVKKKITTSDAKKLLDLTDQISRQLQFMYEIPVTPKKEYNLSQLSHRIKGIYHWMNFEGPTTEEEEKVKEITQAKVSPFYELSLQTKFLSEFIRRMYFSEQTSEEEKEVFNDVLSAVESKATQDTWVRIKSGIYKGDLAKVVYVDNVRQKVKVKLIPRIDLQALANKLEGKKVETKKARPPPHIMNLDEALELNIPVGRKWDVINGDFFDYIDGMLFKDGFLHKTVPIKSISTQSIQPSYVELENFQQPNDESDDEETTGIYLSDLSEEQLMALFSKAPMFRFELRSVAVKWYKNLGKQLKLSGSIQAAECRESLGVPSPDLTPQYGFLKSFNHEYKYDDPVAVHSVERTLYLNDYHCSIPASNSVQIHAELHLTAKEEVVEKDDAVFDFYAEGKDVEKDDDYHNDAICGLGDLYTDGKDDVVKNNDDDAIWGLGDLYADGKDDVVKNDDDDAIWGLGDLYADDKDDVVKNDDDHNEMERDDDDLSFIDAIMRLGEIQAEMDLLQDTWGFLEEEENYVKNDNYNEAVDYNKPYEVCKENFCIDLSEFAKRPCGGSGRYILNGKDGSMELFYAAVKYTVDAVLEVEFFDATGSKEIQAGGIIMAYYSEDFDFSYSPDMRKLNNEIIFHSEEPEDSVKPGKINLMRNTFPVPANSCLIIYATLGDFSSGERMFSGIYEFHVPRNGSSSLGSIEGDGWSLKLKVDWKLPFVMTYDS